MTGSDVEVEAVLLVDEKTVTLKRSLHEVWKKISGSAQPIYTGDETLVWIDEVPVKLVKNTSPTSSRLPATKIPSSCWLFTALS